jgi:hypothetical protein
LRLRDVFEIKILTLQLVLNGIRDTGSRVGVFETFHYVLFEVKHSQVAGAGRGKARYLLLEGFLGFPGSGKCEDLGPRKDEDGDDETSTSESREVGLG